MTVKYIKTETKIIYVKLNKYKTKKYCGAELE